MKRKENIKIFAASSMLNDLGADAIKPFWPSFVTSVLGAPAYVLGILDGLGEAISYGIRWPAGYFADKIKRKKHMVWFGYLMAGFARIGYSISKTVGLLFPFKAIDRLGKLRDPPRDSMLAEASGKERGKAFGLVNAADNVGAMLAPLFGLLLFTFFGYRITFAIAAIPSIISAFLIFFFIKEKKGKHKSIFKNKNKQNFSKEFKKYLVFNSIFGLSWISISFMLLFAGIKNVDITFFPIFLFIVSFFSVISSYVFGKISDKFGRKKTLALCYGIYSLMLFGFFCFYFFSLQKFLILFLLFCLYGISFGSITTLQPALAIDLAEHKKAEASGIVAMFFGFSALLASTIAGFLWTISPALPFCISAFLAIISAILLLSLKHK